eukprot:446694-Prymnesium_polylepis.2
MGRPACSVSGRVERTCISYTLQLYGMGCAPVASWRCLRWYGALHRVPLPEPGAGPKRQGRGCTGPWREYPANGCSRNVAPGREQACSMLHSQGRW